MNPGLALAGGYPHYRRCKRLLAFPEATFLAVRGNVNHFSPHHGLWSTFFTSILAIGFLSTGASFHLLLDWEDEGTVRGWTL